MVCVVCYFAQIKKQRKTKQKNNQFKDGIERKRKNAVDSSVHYHMKQINGEGKFPEP